MRIFLFRRITTQQRLQVAPLKQNESKKLKELQKAPSDLAGKFEVSQ